MSSVFKAVLAALLVILAPSAAWSRDTITWASLDFPPWMILEGPHRGQGVWDELQQYLIDALPEYDHRVQVMNNERYELLARQGEKVCKVYYFKTPARERLLHYSIPSVVFLANQVVMRADKAALLGHPTHLSLAALLQDPRFAGTVVKGRSYGPQIDALLRAHLAQGRVREAVTTNESLFQYLADGRTDYILEFPAVRDFFEQDLSARPALVNIAIDEADPANLTYVTCVRNAWGAAVIARVDRLLERRIASPAHRSATLRWYLPADQQTLGRFYDRLLLAPLHAPEPAHGRP
ncbi:MAG: TIGR02285 family protein [Burkholderiales bacterium]|nr:TIGR02285 family protein [Burkholderiales bacterium]MDE2394483.1 TIGR02285 family protein [Burkholderiales bacterium]